MSTAKPILGGVCAKLGKTHNSAVAYRVGFVLATLLGFFILTPIVYGVLWLWNKNKQ